MLVHGCRINASLPLFHGGNRGSNPLGDAILIFPPSDTTTYDPK
jgi:hypothetical protein